MLKEIFNTFKVKNMMYFVLNIKYIFQMILFNHNNILNAINRFYILFSTKKLQNILSDNNVNILLKLLKIN